MHTVVLDRGIERWPSRRYAVAKRALDIVVSALLLGMLSPLFALVALLIKVTTHGPVFFAQQRCGRNGRTFRCYKFRTMVQGAEIMKESLLTRNEMTGPVFKIRNDPRITPLGRVLRKTSIDELPQLWNVLRGDMSLVGPRPPLPEEVATYTPREHIRLSVPPGLTCLWQVSGRSDLDFDRWIELDIEYIRRRCFWYDLWLLVRTVPAVLTGRGAL
jgi:exopolysaccharide biosynthesis polyprenyl glycosylphosphotransferase